MDWVHRSGEEERVSGDVQEKQREQFYKMVNGTFRCFKILSMRLKDMSNSIQRHFSSIKVLNYTGFIFLSDIIFYIEQTSDGSKNLMKNSERVSN